MSPPNEGRNIIALQQRYDDLRTKKIQAETNLTASTETLERFKRQAREMYGTDDLEVLRARLEDMKNENHRKLAEYDQHLTNIEQQLLRVEAEHAKAANQEAKE